MFVMRTSKGGLNHEQIMRMTWRQFGVYLDSAYWIIREETKEGRGKNFRDDMEYLKGAPTLYGKAKAAKTSMVEETRKKTQKIRDAENARIAEARVKKAPGR